MTRADLSPGLQAAQAAHAAFQFSAHHPSQCRRWHDGSNCLVLLTVPDEEALRRYEALIDAATDAYTVVREPDLDDQVTAIAVGPSPLGSSFAHLPLAGRTLV